MISTVMLIALGFLAASLVALLIMPYVWRHAVKSTSRRLQFAAPDSVVEVRADRDQLRAEHALATRKLELRIRDLKEKLAADAVENTRASTTIEQLNADIAEKDATLEELRNEIAELRASMSPMETELASRSGTVQQLRETIRKLEERAHEQDQLIARVIETAGLEQEQIDELRATITEREQKGPPLPMELTDVHEALTERLVAFGEVIPTLRARRKSLARQRQTLLKLKDKLSGSRTISAREAKNYQTRIAELDDEQAQLAGALDTARRTAGALEREVNRLDKMWRDQINPYSEMREKIDAVRVVVDESAVELNDEVDVRSLLAAIPGGKGDGAKNAFSFDDDGPVFGVAEDREPKLPMTKPEAEVDGEDALADAKPGAPDEPDAAPAEKKKGRLARVKSLASRIRALQSEIG